MDSSRFERMKMGALMGGTVGLCVGLVFGTVNLMRFGPGSRGYIQTLGSYMAGSAASFAFFMGIGTAIRTEGDLPKQLVAPYDVTVPLSPLSPLQQFRALNSAPASIPAALQWGSRVPVYVNQRVAGQWKLSEKPVRA